MLRQHRSQLLLVVACLLAFFLVAGYTLLDDSPVQLQNHVLHLDKQGAHVGQAEEVGEGSSGAWGESSPLLATHPDTTQNADEAPDPAKDAQRAPDNEANGAIAGTMTAASPKGNGGSPAEDSKSTTPDPNTESRSSRPVIPRPAMGYKDGTAKNPEKDVAPEAAPIPGWRKVDSWPAGQSPSQTQVNSAPSPTSSSVADDRASHGGARPTGNTEASSEIDEGGMQEDITGFENARAAVSYDKTTPPSVGCEEIVADLQAKVIETFAEEFKGIRYAHVFGLLDATENKGDAVIWVAQEILLATLGITTMESCRYIDKDCNIARWRAGLVEYAPYSAIIMAGGGNFNDFFEDDHPARLKMVQEYGDHWPIRMFPQSINMTTVKWTERTLETFGNATDAQLAARDLPSYEWLKQAFGKDAQTGLQVGNVRHTHSPDVAFMFGNRPDIRRNTAKKHDIYILARDDTEVSDGESSDVPLGVGVFDFGPEAGDVTYLKNDWRRVPTPLQGEQGPKQRNWAKAMHGFEMLASAEFVITDRLHGHIMSTLMGIPHVLMDSKLRKNLFYHDTWTRDCDCVRVADNIEEAVEIARLYFERQTREGLRKKKTLNARPTE